MDPRFPMLPPQTPAHAPRQSRAAVDSDFPLFALPLAEWTVFGSLLLLMLQT
jgi:hypothetical protein